MKDQSHSAMQHDAQGADKRMYCCDVGCLGQRTVKFSSLDLEVADDFSLL